MNLAAAVISENTTLHFVLFIIVHETNMHIAHCTQCTQFMRRTTYVCIIAVCNFIIYTPCDISCSMLGTYARASERKSEEKIISKKKEKLFVTRSY